MVVYSYIGPEQAGLELKYHSIPIFFGYLQAHGMDLYGAGLTMNRRSRGKKGKATRHSSR
jgi:hypothetical protein